MKEEVTLHDDDDDDDALMSELSKPIGTVEEKWKLLPHFLRMRVLMRQHIDSFNHLIKTDIRNIVTARSNVEVRSEADPKFFLRYTVRSFYSSVIPPICFSK